MEKLKEYKWIWQTLGMALFFLFIISIPITLNYFDYKTNYDRYIIEIKFCDNRPNVIDTVMEYPKIRLRMNCVPEFQDQHSRLMGEPCKQYINVCDIKILKHYKI